MNELAGQAAVDPDAQGHRAMYASAFAVVVDAPADHETLSERRVGECHANWIGTGWMLPDATPRLKLEILQDGGADPEPGAPRIANEAFARCHWTVTETSTRGAGAHPGTGLRAVGAYELDFRVLDVLDEVVEHFIGRHRPHANADAVEVFFEGCRLVARGRTANADLPHAVDSREITRSSCAE